MDKKSVGEKFCDSLYQVMAYSCKRILDEDFRFGKEELYSYTEVFEHFDYVMLQLQPFKQLMDYYDDISTELVGFAITKDADDFEVEILNDETLLALKSDIDDECNRRNLLTEKTESSSAKKEKVVRCDDCELLGNNGICGFCKETMECYDSHKDLVDGVLPKCPKKKQKM